MPAEISNDPSPDDQCRPTSPSPSSSPSSSPTGWTTVHPHSRYTRRFRPGQGNTIVADDSGKKKRKDLSFALALTPRSTTIDILRKDYAKHKAELAASKFWKTTEKFITSDLKERSWNWSTSSIKTEQNKNRKVICLGLGSMSSVVGWRISLDQLAYLELWLESLLGKEGVAVEKYAQDPAFNDMDEVLLREMGYKVVKDPRGFEVIDQDSLVFAPHLDHVFTHKFWLRNPSMAVCNDVMIWGNTMSIQEYCEKYPAFDEVIEKYQKFVLPKSNEVNNGRAFNDTVIYWSPNSVAIDVALKSKAEQEVIAAGIKVSVTPPSRESSPMGVKRGTTSVGKDAFVNTVKVPAAVATSTKMTTCSAENGERVFLSPTAWIPTKEQGFLGYLSSRSTASPQSPPMVFPYVSSPLSGCLTADGEDFGQKAQPTPAKGFSPEQMRNRFKNRKFAKPPLRRRDAGFQPLQGDVILEEADQGSSSPTEGPSCTISPLLSLDVPITVACGYDSSDSVASNASSTASVDVLSPFSPTPSPWSDSSVESSPGIEQEGFCFSPAFPEPVKDDHSEVLKSPPFIALDSEFSFSSPTVAAPVYFPLSSVISDGPTSSSREKQDCVANDGVLNEKDHNQQKQTCPTQNQGRGFSKPAGSISEEPIPVPLMTAMCPRHREVEGLDDKDQTSGSEGTSVGNWSYCGGFKSLEDDGLHKPPAVVSCSAEKVHQANDDHWLTVTTPANPFDDPMEADDDFSDEDFAENIVIENCGVAEGEHPIKDLRLDVVARAQVLDLCAPPESREYHHIEDDAESSSDEDDAFQPHRPQFNPFKDLSTSPIRFEEIELLPPRQPSRRCLLDDDEWEDDEEEYDLDYGFTHYDQEDADNFNSYCHSGGNEETPSSNHAWSFFKQGGNSCVVNHAGTSGLGTFSDYGSYGGYGGCGGYSTSVNMYFRGNRRATKSASLLRAFARGDRGPWCSRWDVC
ncbi:hypothetical protein BJ508DRAFT_324797 [Ascobolus immersus RN42]|uniref:SRR1-like domain-containing protein n=1 Tax=Ascobolus immersus RN42 TaxID=1160509 RepID=A0A3N4ICK8_ASCIM|nr:hypothetical protein BJ508DRAFT_324797 [Ascobolus immersus RN42]